MVLPESLRNVPALLVTLIAFCAAGPSAAELPAEVRLALAGRDYSTAIDWLSAHTQEPDAAFELGKLYRLGQGVDKDPDRAAVLFESAARAGNSDAQYMLGKHHERCGNIEDARYWMRGAADLDHSRARAWLEQNAAVPAADSNRELDLFSALRASAAPPATLPAGHLGRRDQFGRTALMEAVEADAQPWVEALIAAGAGLNDQDPLGNTPLHFAVGQGNRSAVDLLLAAGADPDVAAQDGSTPLHLAVAAGDSGLVQVLLAHAASTALRNNAGWSPASLAARSDDGEIRAAFGVSQPTGNRRLSRLAETGQSQEAFSDSARRGDWELLAQLLDRGADINATDASGYTALAHAVRHGQADTVQRLLRRGAAIGTGLPDGQSLLHIAAAASQPEALTVILTADSQVDAQNSSAQSPLMVAVVSGCQRCADLLLAAGAQGDVQDLKGQTALIVALRYGAATTALDLVERARHLDRRDQFGRNALWWAAKTGQTDAVEALLARGLSLVVDEEGVSPLHLAAEGDYADIATLLIPHSDLNAQSASGNTPLLRAAQNRSASVTEVLIKAGAQVGIRNNVGDTALIAAVRAGDVRCAELLLQAGASPNIRNQRFESALSLIKQRDDPEWRALLKLADSGLLSLLKG
ncbi:MAG: ankyrin repeat domain-containing protein [Pseudomonadales bacterium]